MNQHEQWTGERIIWRNPREHLSEFRQVVGWYVEAMGHSIGKRVLDAACGTGFGSFLLTQVADEVMGIDVVDMIYEEQWEPLADAAGGKLRFGVVDLETQDADFSADVCVSIETIEHLENPDKFLGSLRATSLFFTIPCYGDRNPFHKIEYNEVKAAELIKRHFPNLTYRMENRRMIGFATKNVSL